MSLQIHAHAANNSDRDLNSLLTEFLHHAGEAINAEAVPPSASSTQESSPQPSATSSPNPNPDPAPPENAAVTRCTQAYHSAYRNAVRRDGNDWRADIEGRKAYSKALPLLSGRKNIRDFIACVAHGMLINAINYSDGPMLLNAARVANLVGDKRSHHASTEALKKASKSAQ